MIFAHETFGVDLVDVFGTGWTRREPAILGHDLEAADGLIVPRCMAEHAENRLTGQFGGFHLIG